MTMQRDIRIPILALTLLGAWTLAATPAAAQSGADFYKGKTITYVVATGPGGGHDLYARMMAKNIERYLPGATVVIKNVPGAGHIIGANQVYAAKPDGLTIGTFSTGLTYTQIIGQESVKFDFTKFSWVGKQATDTRVLFMTNISKMTTWEAVKKAPRTIRLGTSGVGSGAYNESFMIAKAFDLKVDVLSGYSGGEAIMGMMRGEIDGRVGGLSSQQEEGDTGTGADVGQIVLQFGDPELKEIPDGLKLAETPLQQAVAKMMIGEGQLYRVVVGPPGIPKDRLDALRTAFTKALTSKEYREEAEKANRPFDKTPVPADQVQKMASDIINIPPEMVDLLKKLTAK
jgi:tripartite-type tricarboxylate transporter receptor subunit TctC